MGEHEYEDLGLVAGLEIHQQLNTKHKFEHGGITIYICQSGFVGWAVE